MIDVAPAAGWYRDPSDPASMRWWSGAGWTAHVQSIEPAPPQPPIAAVAATAAPVAVSAPAAYAGAVPVHDERWTSNYTDDELQLYTTRGRAQAVAPTVSRGQLTADGRTLLSFERTAETDFLAPVPNGAAWMVAAMPLLAILVAFAVVGLQTMGAIPASLPSSGLGIVVTIATIAAAVQDRKTLRSAGLPAVSAAWVLLGAVFYLGRRSWVLRGRPGVSGPMILGGVTAFLQAIVIGLAVALVGLSVLVGSSGASSSGAAGSPGGSAAAAHLVENTIEQSLVSQGQTGWQVDCPAAEVTVTPNSAFQCAATTVDGRKGVVAVAIDAQGTMSYTLTAQG